MLSSSLALLGFTRRRSPSTKFPNLASNGEFSIKRPGLVSCLLAGSFVFLFLLLATLGGGVCRGDHCDLPLGDADDVLSDHNKRLALLVICCILYCGKVAHAGFGGRG